MNELIGQEPARKYLHAILASRRMAHGFLFKGPAGVGKRTAAYAFVQAALCHNPQAGGNACGTCKSCRWIAARRGNVVDHPDVIPIKKFSVGKDSKLLGDQEQIIPIETVQDFCQQLHLTPMAGRKRAVIVPEAHRLCMGRAESANAFLKTLEEPPAASLIVLTSSRPEALLETIVSRVQGVSFRRLSLEEVRGGLARHAGNKDKAEVEMVATLADGSLGRAIELLHGDLKSWRNAVLKGLERFDARANPAFGLLLWTLADAEGKRLFSASEAADSEAESSEEEAEVSNEDERSNKTESGWKRYVLGRLLELCEVCFRDGLVCAAAGKVDNGLLLQPDQSALSAGLAAKFGEEGCQKVLEALRESALAVRLYIKGDVVGRALAGKMVEALKS